jgi:hypothetical protein
MQKMKSSISIHRLARITVIQEPGKYDTTFLRVPWCLVVKENEYGTVIVATTLTDWLKVKHASYFLFNPYTANVE